MKYIAKSGMLFHHKATNRAVGKVVEIKEGDSIDNYVEVELPEPMKKLVDKIREWKTKNGK